MDINEVTGKKINRHPWELSRTYRVLKEFYPYIKKMGDDAEFVSIGAGDMYFDKHILKMRNNTLHAVDIGYATEKRDLVKTDSDRIKMYNSIDELGGGDRQFDYGMMLDSLEYMPDDVAYLKSFVKMIKPGGYLFFTLPAYSWLFSGHDEIVGNLRRYSRQEFAKVINQVPEIKIIRSHYFYFSLFIVRLMQKAFRVNIDPEHKVTTGWEHKENSFTTNLVKGFLNIDYAIGLALYHIGIKLPGLSLVVVCQKD